MKKSILSVLLIFAFLLCACGAPIAPVPPEGIVYAIQSGTTLYWIEAALTGQPGTYIMQKGSDLLFLWKMNTQGIGFSLVSNTQNAYRAIFDWERVTGAGGNLVNFTTAEKFIDYMKDQGWKFISAGEVARETGRNMLNALRSVSQNMITIVILPAAIFENFKFDCPPGYYQCVDG